MDRQHQDHPLDPLTDPNFIMAMGLMNNIKSSQVDHLNVLTNRNETIAEAQRREELRKAEEAAKKAAQDTLTKERTPVEKIVDKLQDKRILTREEVIAITLSLSKEFSSDFKNKSPELVQQYLSFVYYVVLNIQPFSHGRNYLENQSLLKLLKELFNVVKLYLEFITSKKETGGATPLASLMNSFLPISFKILALFQLPSSSTQLSHFDMMHYKYLRSTHVKALAAGQLQATLNPLLKEYMAAEHKQGSAGSASSETVIIEVGKQVAQQITPEKASNEDFIMSTLEFVPQEYSIMAKSLQEQVHSTFVHQNDENMSINDEEEKEEGKIENVDAAIKELINKQKLPELYGKAVDRLVLEEELYLQVDSSLFSVVKQYLSKLPQIKSKHFIQFTTKTVCDRATKTQQAIIEHFNKLKDVEAMQIDQIEQGEIKELQENTRILAKCLEICPDDTAFIIEIVKESGSLKYLSKLINVDSKKETMSSMIESIALSYCNNLQLLLSDGFLQTLEPQQLHDIIVILFRMIIITRDINSKKKEDGSLKLFKSMSVMHPSSNKQSEAQAASQKSVRTRGQAKRQKQDISSSLVEFQEEKKHENIIQMALVNVDVSDLLKTSISLLASSLPFFIRVHNKVQLSADFLKNLIRLAQNHSSVIGSLITGILSEFTKPTLCYDKFSITQIGKILHDHLQQILQSPSQTIIAIKLMFQISNSKSPLYDKEISLKIAKELIANGKWQAPKQNEIQNIASSQNFTRFIMLVACLFSINQNASEDLQNQRQILARLAQDQIDSLDFGLQLQVLQMTLFSSQSLGTLKITLMKFLTSLFNENDLSNQINSLSSEVNASLNGIISNPQAEVFDKQLQELLKDKLSINYFLDLLIKNFEGFLSQAKQADLKTQLLALLKKFTFICLDKDGLQISPKVDLQTFLQNSCSNVDILFSQYDMHVKKSSQAVLTKLQAKTALNEEEAEFINSSMRSLIELSKAYLEESMRAVKNKVASLDPSCQNVDINASIIYESTKCIQNVFGINKCLTQCLDLQSMSLKPEDVILQRIADPQNLSKTIYNLRGNQQAQLKLEDTIYAHCFSSFTDNMKPEAQQLQRITSQQLMLRSLYSCLSKFVSYDSVANVQQIAQELYRISFEIPFLEYSDNANGSFDNEISDKTFNRIVNGNQSTLVTNKEFQKFKSLDHVLNLLVLSRDTLQSSASLQNLVAEVAAQTPVFTQFIKSSADFKGIINYLHIEDSDVARFLKATLPYSQKLGDNLPVQIWSLALSYIEMTTNSAAVEVKTEKKGGMQMVIELDQPKKQEPPKGMSTRQKKKNVRFGKDSTQEEAKQVVSSSQETTDPPQQKVQKTINPIASKLLNFMIEVMSTNAQSLTEQKSLAESLRMTFGSLGSQTVNIVERLYETKQVLILKQLVGSLVKTTDHQIQANLSNAIVHFLHQSKGYPVDKRLEALLLSLELAEFVTVNNQELASFISSQLLDHSSDFFSSNESQLTKFQILDFMCQLAMSKYVQDQKYAAQQIYNLRKQHREEIKQREDLQKIELAKTLSEQVENQAESIMGVQKSKTHPDNIEIEGFKQEKFVQSDKDSLRYMEWPEEYCTYSITKKVFREQHWYVCYTCGLKDNSGCCGVCVKKCHKGHAVAYQKRTNFFCDCGDSGRCKCLNREQQHNQQPVREPARFHARDQYQPHPRNELVFEQNIGGQRNPFGMPSFPVQVNSFKAHGFLGQSDSPKYHPQRIEDDMSEGDPKNDFEEFLRRQQLRLEEGDHSSEDDLDPMGNGRIGQSIKSVMKMIKKVPDRLNQNNGGGGAASIFQQQHHFGAPPHHMRDHGENQMIFQDMIDRGVIPPSYPYQQIQPPQLFPPFGQQQQRFELQSEQSHIEQINPLEDPFSEAGMDTIDHNQLQLGFSQSNLGIIPSGGDTEMKQEIQVEQLIPEVVSFIQAQSSHFKEVYAYLCTALTDSLSKAQLSQSQDQLMVEESKQPTSGNFQQRLNDFLNIPKEKLSLVQDQVQYKKIINQGQFQVKLQNDNSIRPAMQNSINLVNIVDSNKNGLVAICEDQEVCFYGGSQFFEDAAHANKDQEIFKFQHKEGNNISKIDTQRVSFPPLQVLFNEIQPQYLAVAGPQNVEVVVLQKNGKVDYKIPLDLMLETFGRDLTIVNIRWLPGSQTSLAVGTRDFIKIYDLGLDVLSPTHNVMIFNGFVTDFAFSQNPKVNGNQAETTLFATSRSGQVFYMNINYTVNSYEAKQDGEKMNLDQDNSDMMMTEALQFDNKLLKFKENQTQALSVYCTSQNILLLTFNEGLTLVGTKDPMSGSIHGFRFNVQEDPSFNQSNCKTVWQKHGESLCGFREIVPFTPNRRDSKLVLLGYSRKFGNNQIASHGIPLMIEIKETKLIVNVVKNSQIGSSSNNMVSVIGQAYVRKSHRGSNQMRLLNVMVDSAAATYFCKTIYQEKDNEEEKQVQDPMMKIENDIKLAHGNVDMLISKSDLPHEAQLCQNFFEKTKSFIKEQSICQQLNFTGEILNTFRTLKATQEILARSLSQNSAIIQEASKKTYKFSVTLDPSSDYVITGLRIRLDYSPLRQQNHCISMKLFNREQKFPNYIGRGHGSPILFDIPFCDAEILYGTSSSNQNLTFEFQTEDPKQIPIRIVSIDIHGLSKKDFMFREKMRKLERLNAERLKKSLSSLMVVPSNEVLNDQLVKDELLDTKQLPIVSAREKYKYLSGQIDKNEVEAVIAIDILTQYLSMVQPSLLGLDLEQLLEKLKSQLSPDNSLNKFELAAVKRCIKKVISVVSPQAGLGHPHNYQTIKDQMLLSFVKKRLEQRDFTKEQFRLSLRALLKVNTKRFYQVFKMIEDDPLLVPHIIEAYIDLKKKDTSNSSKQQQQDICDLVGLIVANYQFKINQQLGQFTQIEDAINAIYSEESFTEVFQLLKPLLDHEDEQVQKLTISNIMNIASQYSKTLQVSLKKNKVPIVKYNNQTHKIILIDFCPHLISYAFNLISSGNCDIGYQLAFKMTKSFEVNCLKNYDGKFTQQIVNRVVKFISSQAFLQIKPSQLLLSGDTSSSMANRNLYANLILTNIFLHHPQKDENIKIKSINLGLDQSIQKKIIESLTNHQPLLVTLVEWTHGMIKVFANEFMQQRCSYRTKFDDGIPGKVYQVLNNQGMNAAGGGRQLLRPVVETVAWKWHPIFLKSDSQFDLLDRKIPVQIMMLINFLISQAEQLDKYDEASGKLTELVQQISEFAFRKPASSFLKEVGRLAIKSIMYSLNNSNPEKQKDIDNTIEKTIRGNAIFNDFYITFSKIYEQAFNKKGQPQLTYNLQFQLHAILEKGWNKASNNVETWSHFITAQNSQRYGLVETLVNSAFYLNEESAKLCIQLAALSYDETCVLSFKKIDQIQISLFTIFQKSHLKQNDEKTSIKSVNERSANLDIRKLIEVMLLGRNNKAIRTATSHLIKGVYDHFTAERQFIKNALIEKLPLLRTKGANSLEFVALLSYIINREIETGGFQREEELYQKLCREIYKQVVRTNQSLTAHENLNIYATLSKLVPSFTQSGSQDLMIGFDEQSFRQMIESRSSQSFLEASRNSASKISNPYMLESEACSKCFSQKPLPFQQQRAQDLKIEAKFTDSRHIYKLNQAYQIKQLTVNQDQFRGNKYAKEVTLYINNSQGVDLADMKNNMALWKKVKTQEAEAGQRVIIIDLTLPVTAQNILVEFTTGITSKIIDTKAERHRHQNPDGKQKIVKKKKVNIDSIDKVLGIDSVIMSLPKHIAGTIGLLSDQSDLKDVQIQGASDYDKLMCPRCQRPIQSKNGVCNNCGENAQQCPQCRNINYDKQDAYVCTECGFSRWVKMDIQLVVQQGFACEKIENEEQKAQALQQIESNLQQAQQAYQSLMKNRLAIMQQIKKANEGSDNQRAFVAIYQEDCAELYQKMMRSLNNIKSLKYEIDQFTSGATQQIEEIKIKRDDDLKPLTLNRSYSAISSPEENQVQETCFSCIQEYLKGLLCFIQITAEKLSTQYKKQGFLELLYKENLKMYTHQLQDPTRRALCSLLKSDKDNTEGLLKQIGQDLFNKQTIIPSHQLSQNITQETLLILDMLRVQGTLKAKEKPAENFYDLIMSYFWIILFKALVQGKNNSAIADQIAGSLIQYVREQAKASSDSKADQTQKDMNGILVSMFDQTKRLDTQEFRMFEAAQQEQLNGKNFIIQSLLLQSSQKVRQEAKDIIQHISSNQDLHKSLLTQLLSILDQVLVLESSSSDQFFDLIQLLLTNLKDKIQPGDTTGNIYLQTFDQLLKHIDSELVKLFTQELQRKKLGADGYMPQISTGQALSRIVTLVSYMIKESSELKKRIQNNVNFVIKAFLKVKKLNLSKNKIIQNSEVEIEKMFKELHSEKEEEKANFILTCIKVIENGDCDIQEMRFLFEEICKVIDPVKPEPDYQLQFTRPRSQEEFFGGRMSKNGYTSSQFGKSMGDVRIKICKETNTAEPELVELLVDNKLINLDLTVKQVYEQVHWPALYKQRNPESYDIPGIEEATQLTPMIIVYRLMGIDGEATEDRVESLQDGSEGDMDPANIQKKYGTTEILSRPFNSQQADYQTTGIQVLTQILDQFGSLVTHRYLAEWLFKLLGFALKIKSNRLELLKQRKTVDNLAKRLLESVGMQSQVENQKGATLFDVILVLLELVISEVNLNDNKGVDNDASMEIDQQLENQETAKNVQIFIKILGDSCSDMVANGQGLDKTSKKIKAVSKILPFLINKEDIQAQEILIQFITEALSKIFVLDNLAEMTAKEKFVAQFNLERVIEILDSIPSSKNYIKDMLHQTQGENMMPKILTNLQNTTLVDLRNEVQIYKHKLGNSYTLRFLYTYTKNHPVSQRAIFTQALIDKLYDLTETKYKDRSLTILGNDIMQSLTNKNHNNDPNVLTYFQKLIDQAVEDKKRQAQKKKEEIMKQMLAKKTKTAGQFQKQMDTAQEKEGGPKCIVCLDDYTKKPTEVLGMYVFSKKLKICEMSEGGSGFISTQGYTTVTHSNFIHFTCHQNAVRADERLKIPKREWEGAIIRNEHSKCNNLFPIRGGNLRIDDYGSMVERYFQSQVKTAGNCDPDRVKVILHDLKMIMKRLAYEDSFSRDTHGGGPEHNMHLLPFMIQMSYYILQANPSRKPDEPEFIYQQEKRLAQFLQQGIKMKRDFLQKLEEEKKQGEIEEEEKGRESSHYGEEEDGSSHSHEGASKQNANIMSEENSGQMGDFSIDQIAFMLTSALMFSQLPKWETYKEDFLTIILCTCANIKEEATAETKPMAGQSDFATGKKVLSIGKNDDVAMKDSVPSDAISGLGTGETAEARKRRLSSDNKSELIQKALIRVRPLLVLMRIVDAVKHTWDQKRLQLPQTGLKHDAYLKRLNEEVISHGNLKDVIIDCDELFREYKDRILKISSVEDFLQDMGLLNKIVAENQQATVTQSLEQFILKHF